MLPQKKLDIKNGKRKRQGPASPLCGINFPPYSHNITTTSLSTVSTISSNYHPLLIDMNNNRGKVVNGEHNSPRQKAKHCKSHFTAGASRRRRLGCSQWAGERYFTADIHLPPESHFISGSPIKQYTRLQKLHFHDQIHKMASFLLPG